MKNFEVIENIINEMNSNDVMFDHDLNVTINNGKIRSSILKLININSDLGILTVYYMLLDKFEGDGVSDEIDYLKFDKNGQIDYEFLLCDFDIDKNVIDSAIAEFRSNNC